MALDRSLARTLVSRAAQELADAEALDVLEWADRVLDGRLLVASSMQDAVLVDLATKVCPHIDVVFLDTGYHFAETLGLRDAVAAAYPARVLTVSPSQSVEEQDAALGPRLHDRNPDLCCFLRKVQPFNAMIRHYDGWVTGLRRAEADSRADVRTVEWDERRQVLKVNPLVDWSDDDVAAYVADNEVLVNPLVADGYPSIGCAPCTARARGDDPRAGRWAGKGKRECGLHR